MKTKQSLIDNDTHGHNKHLELHFTWSGALQHLLIPAKEYHNAIILPCKLPHPFKRARSECSYPADPDMLV